MFSSQENALELVYSSTYLFITMNNIYQFSGLPDDPTFDQCTTFFVNVSTSKMTSDSVINAL